MTVAARIEDGTVEERAEGEWSLRHDAAELPVQALLGYFRRAGFLQWADVQ